MTKNTRLEILSYRIHVYIHMLQSKSTIKI